MLRPVGICEHTRMLFLRKINAILMMLMILYCAMRKLTIRHKLAILETTARVVELVYTAG